jgi:hypothetical protein
MPASRGSTGAHHTRSAHHTPLPPTAPTTHPGCKQRGGKTRSGGGRPSLLQLPRPPAPARTPPSTPSPKQLDGKTYGSYGARYEGRIVQEIIRKDGGAGDYSEVTPPMLEVWDRFLKVRRDEVRVSAFASRGLKRGASVEAGQPGPRRGMQRCSCRANRGPAAAHRLLLACPCCPAPNPQGEVDATWVFMPWEGVLAQRAGAWRQRPAAATWSWAVIITHAVLAAARYLGLLLSASGETGAQPSPLLIRP